MAILNLGATGHAFKDETFEKVASNLKSNLVVGCLENFLK